MVTQTYKLNMIPNGQILNVHVSQYDIGREIVFNLYNGSETFTPISGTTATIDGTKPDKKGFSLAATISGSTARFTTTKNMCAVAGDTICEFRLMKNGQNIGTANFTLKVERAGLADDVDTSATELPAYEAAAQQAAQDAADSAGAASSSATSAATNALKSEGYAVGKQNGQAVASGSPYYHNNAEYFSGLAGQSATNAANSATAAAASVAQGTQVNFYIENGHLFVVQTIGGVEQQPQDLGPVGGGGALSELSDVSLTSPTNGQLLSYDSASGKWINRNPSGGSSRSAANVKTNYTSNISGVTISAALSRVWGNITTLEIGLNIAAGTTIGNGNTRIFTLDNYSSHKDLVPYDHGIVMNSYFTSSYVPISDPCNIIPTLIYNGSVEFTMQNGGHTFSSACTMELLVTFINNLPVSGVSGGGTSFTEETYVPVASRISVIGSLPLSVYFARMHRYGRDTYLEICLKTTAEWTFSASSLGVIQITDSDGKLTPFWLDSQHQCVYQCGCASFNGAPLFIARMFYWDATHSTVVLEPSEGRTASANVEIYLSLHFTNKYDE